GLEPGPNARPITVPAAVVHSIRAGGAGLVFTELAAPERERLRRLVHDLAARGGGEAGAAARAQAGRIARPESPAAACQPARTTSPARSSRARRRGRDLATQ